VSEYELSERALGTMENPAESCQQLRDDSAGRRRPHIGNNLLIELGLAGQLGGERFSQVSRITRFARW